MLFFDTYEFCTLLRKNKSIISNSPLGKNSLSCHFIRVVRECYLNCTLIPINSKVAVGKVVFKMVRGITELLLSTRGIIYLFIIVYYV